MPKNSSKSTYTVETLLAGHTPPVRELVERLRRSVRRTVPEATETAYPRWHGIGYRHLRSGYFCTIFPQEDHVLLSFEFGVLLPDPLELLKGEGKQVRYVPIREQDFIEERAFATLIQAALDFPPGRDAKLGMIRGGFREG